MYSYLVVPVFILAISYYKGLFSKPINWLTTRQQRLKLLISLLDNVPQSTDSTASFSVNDSDLSASIIYQRLGSQYVFFVPYNRSHVAPMTQFTAELLRQGKPPLNITQQPGLPYLVSSSDLGGSTIKITNQDTGLSHEYHGSSIPMYAEEVMDKE